MGTSGVNQILSEGSPKKSWERQRFGPEGENYKKKGAFYGRSMSVFQLGGQKTIKDDGGFSAKGEGPQTDPVKNQKSD